MNHDRRETIDTILSKAAEVPEGERTAFLQQACAGDRELEQDLEKTILEADLTKTTGMDKFLLAATPGTTLAGRFRIVRFVGKGGMGEVYEAEDLELRGRVALKIMRTALSDDPDFLQRFRREVQIARQVTHPNVSRVYDVGHHEGGGRRRVFLTMEFLDGETLDQRLRRVGRISEGEAMPLVRQLAAGLGALHERGIVHRDFKPGNILLVEGTSGPERAVISDFGLARVLEPESGTTVTGTGHVMGTPEYMAPEQLLGRPATPTSDIYALGLVIYKMVTGKRPFPGSGPLENAVKRVTEQPTPPTAQCEGVSPDWNQTILRCLALRPEDRPQSAAAVVAGLEGTPAPARPVMRHRRTWIAAAVLAACLAAIPAGLRLKQWVQAGPSQSNDTANLALLPFHILSDDPAVRVFGAGLAETITSRMSQFENGKAPLLVVPASEVTAQHATSPGEARQKFAVGTAVQGTLESQGDHVRLMLTIVDTRTMRQLDTIVVQDDRSNSWRLQDAAVARLANSLNLRLQPKYAGDVTARPLSPGAYDFYLQARGYLQRSDQSQNLDIAVSLLGRAIKLDPKFAVAYSALGKAYLYKFLAERDPKMMDAALTNGSHAVELDENVAETNIAYGLILQGTGRLPQARERFEKAIALDGRNAEAYQGLAKTYTSLNDFGNAEATYVKAISLKPDDWTGYKALALFYYGREDYAKAAEQFQKVVDLTPDNAEGYLNLGAAQSGRENSQAAEQAYMHALQLDSKSFPALSNLGKLYLDANETRRAIDMYQQALAINSRTYQIWGQLGRAFSRTGDRAKSQEAFAKAVELIDGELLINSKSVVLYSSLGFYRALLGRKDFTVAVDRALELAPDRAQTLLRAAESYAIAGNKQRAAEFLQKALARGVSVQSVQRSEYLTEIRPLVQPK